ncbi:hypothetical protein [Streptomyces adonidis]|uniref:hypothetical protein n=1 Tax=Streptomyces adonidis TaxID=3231367 RepID=UPI0034DB2561
MDGQVHVRGLRVGTPRLGQQGTSHADLEPVLGSYQVGDDATVVTPGNDAGEEQVQLTVTPARSTP